MDKFKSRLNAISAFVGIIGGSFGIYFGFKTIIDSDNNQQIQITELSKQTKYLSDQLIELQTSNALSLMSIKKDDEKWIKQNKPDFEFNFSKYNDWEMYNDGTQKISGIKITNKGGPAYIKNIVLNKNNTCIVSIPLVNVPSNGEISASMTLPKEGYAIIDITLITKDIEGFTYTQRFITDSIKVEEIYITDGGSTLKNINIRSYEPVRK